MQLSFLIDGYNLLHALGILLGQVKPMGLERARRKLQDFLVAALGDDAGRATVIYDAKGAPAQLGKEQAYQGLTILLAVGQQEADDLIEALLDKHSAPRDLAVVSNDHRLQNAARRKGAKPLTCGEFLDVLDERRRQKPRPMPDPEKKERLSAEEIRKWQQEFAGLEDDPDLKEAFKRYDFEDFDPDQ